MAGKHDAPMHQRPFGLIRCQAVDEEGKPVFKHTLWLLVMGQRRREVSLLQAYEAYRQRYDLEHFFRFGKNHLLLDCYRTPEVEYEENWVELACLAYTQLWLARFLAVSLPRPWERYLPERKEREVPGPSEVQRDLGRITCAEPVEAFASLEHLLRRPNPVVIQADVPRGGLQASAPGNR